VAQRQAAFVVTGIAGLLWLVPWLWLYRRPQEHPRITDAERATIAAGQSATAAGVSEKGGATCSSCSAGARCGC